MGFSGPLSSDWSRHGSGGMSRVEMTAPSRPNSQPTTPRRADVGWSRISRTAACGQGAMGVIPADCLARLGRASLTFSSRRPARPHVHPPGFAGAKPPPCRWAYCRGRCEPGTAQLCVQQPFHRGLPRSSCTCLIGVSHGRIQCPRGCRLTDRVKTCRPSSVDEPWGPRPQAAPRCGALFAKGCCAGPAAVSHRLWRARSRATLLPLQRRREHCDPCTQQMRCPGTRLDAEPSSRCSYREQSCGAIGLGL